MALYLSKPLDLDAPFQCFGGNPAQKRKPTSSRDLESDLLKVDVVNVWDSLGFVNKIM